MPVYNALVNTATAYTWPPLVALCRHAIISALSRIQTGQLVITDTSTNDVTIFGALEPKTDDPKLNVANGANGIQNNKDLRAELRVVADVFWVRMLLFADMVRTFCQAYHGNERDNTQTCQRDIWWLESRPLVAQT